MNFIHDEMDETKEKTYKSSKEYCEALNKWMFECNQWYAYHAMFPYFVAQQLQRQSTRAGVANVAVGRFGTATTSNNATNQVTDNQRESVNWSEWRIAPVWKRIAAEILDFLLLFTIKFFVTFIAVDYFEIVDLEKYGSVLKMDKLDKVSYKMLAELTSELMVLELLNRFIICVFEAFCLQGGSGVTSGPGGATPGKSIMGIRVICCEKVLAVDSSKIRVLSAADMGLWRSFWRAIMKNFTIVLCIPASLTVYMFHHNQAVYDVLLSCIVVEDVNPPNNRRIQRLFL